MTSLEIETYLISRGFRLYGGPPFRYVPQSSMTVQELISGSGLRPMVYIEACVVWDEPRLRGDSFSSIEELREMLGDKFPSTKYMELFL